jgi:hypothetical protein
MVSVLFHLPHRDAFHLSLTVLVRYRSEIIFSLGSVVLPDSDRISPVPPYLRINASGVNDFRIRGYYPLWLFFPKDFTNDLRLTPVEQSPFTSQPRSHHATREASLHRFEPTNEFESTKKNSRS